MLLTMITDWIDNTGRKHIHIKMDIYYSGFSNSFTTDLLSIGTGLNTISFLAHYYCFLVVR